MAAPESAWVRRTHAVAWGLGGPCHRSGESKERTINRSHRTSAHEPDTAVELNPVFSRPGESSIFPRFTIPDGESLPSTAYQVVHDEAMLDGNSRLNLATFVGTWMEPEASKLYAETFDKNMIDKDEYPQTALIETRCWRMLADLWNAPDPAKSVGTSTIGSSEACMLGGLALKRRWQHARRAAGLSTDKPNLVLSSAVQVCWEKFCNYWDVEARFVPVSQEHQMLDGYELDKYVDANTIGVVAIMGVTYTGSMNPSRRSRRRWTRSRQSGALIFRSTSTAPPEPWLHLSCNGRPSGTSACRGLPRSTPPATSTAWSTPASAGLSGVTSRHSPRT
ncbi:glutamate decarboxylase [Arthrobacter sp. Hiyo8]|nr:glutamate decarboxylase [Arthrobacter sp. Hiyo8]